MAGAVLRPLLRTIAVIPSLARNWYSSGNTHYVTGSIYIDDGGSLIIHQDCYIEFDQDTMIVVQDGGSLYVDGNPGYWVVMVGNNDDRWYGLIVEQHAEITRFDVEYCGISDAYMGINVSFNTYGDVNLTDCYVYGSDESTKDGISIGGPEGTIGDKLDGTATLIDCYVCYRDTNGIYVRADDIYIDSCSVFDCGKHGIFVESSNGAIDDCSLLYCGEDGIHVWDVDSNTDVVDNHIDHCERGIWRGRGSSGSTYNNEIEDCDIGIYTDDFDGAVTYNDIYLPSGSNTKGIHVYTPTHPTIWYNYITKDSTGNGGYGIHCPTGNPYIRYNEIEYVGTGIYCGPTFVDDWKIRANEISNCDIAIHTDGCEPDFGTSSDHGNHNIHDINDFFFKAEDSNDTIKAEYNWWGSDEPDPNKFSDENDDLDYTPWLEAAP